MAMNDTLANALSKILNSEKIGKKEVLIMPQSKTIRAVLDILNEQGYVGKYEIVQDGKGNHLKLSLLGKVNKCGSIKPRHALGFRDFERFEKRFLPAKNFGLLVVSTPQGLLTHEQAKEKRVGGRLLAYCY